MGLRAGGNKPLCIYDPVKKSEFSNHVWPNKSELQNKQGTEFMKPLSMKGQNLTKLCALPFYPLKPLFNLLERY